tara:strand:+ start:93 stop:410 length:318 start_codon:yes stop_codon:yes gene_type:complete
MELTGKCKEEFERWLHKNLYKDSNYTFEYILELFYSYIPSMQYGVFVDYFDSVWIDVTVFKSRKFFDWSVFSNCRAPQGRESLRPEARTAAIEKANELRNEVLNK